MACFARLCLALARATVSISSATFFGSYPIETVQLRMNELDTLSAPLPRLFCFYVMREDGVGNKSSAGGQDRVQLCVELSKLRDWAVGLSHYEVHGVRALE